MEKVKEKVQLSYFDFITEFANNGNSSHAVLVYAQSLKNENYRQRGNSLTKPVLRQNHSLDELNQYTLLFNTYLLHKKEQDKIEKDIEKNNIDIDYAIELYIKEESGFNSTVPEKYQDKVYALAYQNGHSSGMYDVLNHLIELVAIFE